MGVRNCPPIRSDIPQQIVKMRIMKTSLLLACVVAAIHANPAPKKPDMPVMDEVMARYEKHEPKYHPKNEYKKDEYEHKYDHNEYGYENDDYKSDYGYKKESYGD